MSDPVASESTAVTSEPASQKKPRSRVERTIVWGLIAALLVVVGLEAQAWWGFRQAYGELGAKLRQADESEFVVTQADVRAAVDGLKPVGHKAIYGIMRTADREDIYTWNGLFRSRTMYVYSGSGEDPVVLFITTEREPEPPPFDWSLLGMASPNRGQRPGGASVVPAVAPVGD